MCEKKWINEHLTTTTKILLLRDCSELLCYPCIRPGEYYFYIAIKDVNKLFLSEIRIPFDSKEEMFKNLKEFCEEITRQKLLGSVPNDAQIPVKNGEIIYRGTFDEIRLLDDRRSNIAGIYLKMDEVIRFCDLIVEQLTPDNKMPKIEVGMSIVPSNSFKAIIVTNPSFDYMIQGRDLCGRLLNLFHHEVREIWFNGNLIWSYK